MPRDNRRPREDESPKPTPGLSLSTGRFDGRPGADSSRTRHNPLRDDGHDSDRSESRRSSSPRENRSSSRPGAGRRISAPEPEAPPTLRQTLANAVAAMPHQVKHAGHGQSFRRGIDWQTVALGVVILALVIVIGMAIAHVGPFAPKVQSVDAERHAGIQSLVAVRDNGVYVAQQTAAQMSFARPVEPTLAEMTQHRVTRQDLSSLSGQEAPFAFALNTADSDAETTPVLSDQSLVSLNNALSYYTTHKYDVSYLLMDLGTGRGIAGNLDTVIYGASSFKGPFCAYIAEDELSSSIDKVKSTRLTQIEDTITWSDNSSYGKLRRAFGTDGMEDWLTDAGVDPKLVDDTYYPHYTGRQSALMWLKIYRYLQSDDSSTAQWFSDTLGRTEVSFLRNGALGTNSIGDTDYLPPEGSGEKEADEEAAQKAASQDEADEADGAEGEGEGEGEGETSSTPSISSDASLSVVIAESVKAIEQTELNGAADGTDEDSDKSTSADGEDKSSNDKTIASIGTNITVRNKAGWINGEEDNAICDSGIITINDRDYLMVIMTNSPDTVAGERAFAHLARTLFEIRSDLV